jgi:hypothetical protein
MDADHLPTRSRNAFVILLTLLLTALIPLPPAAAAVTPSRPTGLTATAVDSTSIRLNWQDTATNEQGFWLYVNNNYTSPNLAPNTTTSTRTGLQPATRYCFKVESFNAGGGSGQSVEACAATLPSGVPARPTGLTATAVDSTSIRLNWQDTATNEQGFWLYVNNNYTSPNLAPNTTTSTRTGLQPATRYCFKVESFNAGGGSGQSVEACAATATANRSGNWSGHVTNTGSASQVLGWWTVPSLKCSALENSNASQWIGLGGGPGETPLVQIGTISSCNAGVPMSHGFTQVVPRQATSQPFVMGFNAGDSIEAEVKYLGGNQYSLRLTNNACWCGSYTATVTQPNLSKAPKTAEWIVEQSAEPILGQGLTNFGKVSFESAMFNGRLVTAQDTVKYVLTDQNGPKTTVSNISQFGGHGPNFDVTWVRR